MFIIHRREVQADGKRDKVDAVYWILNDRIYPTPSLYDIMANRTVCPLDSVLLIGRKTLLSCYQRPSRLSRRSVHLQILGRITYGDHYPLLIQNQVKKLGPGDGNQHLIK
jgi:hypothetical protein